MVFVVVTHTKEDVEFKKKVSADQFEDIETAIGGFWPELVVAEEPQYTLEYMDNDVGAVTLDNTIPLVGGMKIVVIVKKQKGQGTGTGSAVRRPASLNGFHGATKLILQSHQLWDGRAKADDLTRDIFKEVKVEMKKYNLQMSDKELRTLILSKLSDKRNKRPHGTPQTGSKPASANTTPSSSFAITPSSSSQSLPVPFDVTDEESLGLPDKRRRMPCRGKQASHGDQPDIFSGDSEIGDELGEFILGPLLNPNVGVAEGERKEGDLEISEDEEKQKKESLALPSVGEIAEGERKEAEKLQISDEKQKTNPCFSDITVMSLTNQQSDVVLDQQLGGGKTTGGQAADGVTAPITPAGGGALSESPKEGENRETPRSTRQSSAPAPATRSAAQHLMIKQKCLFALLAADLDFYGCRVHEFNVKLSETQTKIDDGSVRVVIVTDFKNKDSHQVGTSVIVEKKQLLVVSRLLEGITNNDPTIKCIAPWLKNDKWYRARFAAKITGIVASEGFVKLRFIPSKYVQRTPIEDLSFTFHDHDGDDFCEEL